MTSFLMRGIAGAFIFAGLTGCQMGMFSNSAEPELALLSDVNIAEDAETVSLVAAPSDGFFSTFFSQFSGAGNEVAVGTDTITASAAPTAASPVLEASISTSDNRRPSGLMSLFGDTLTTDEAATPSEPVAFGELRSNCSVRGGALGTKVITASGFTIYDTAPGSTVARSHFIKGFDDRCAREFIGALVLTGDVGTHELVRYSRTRVRLDYSETDNAYEDIKARFCRASRGNPCGDRLERLGQETTFITVYETFGNSPEWAEFLLHDGTVAGVDIESP